MDHHRVMPDQNVGPAHVGPRKYMSKGRRACDFCRSRKSACQIEVSPPCRMCKAHGQQCEFTDRVVRKRRRDTPPGGHARLAAAMQQSPQNPESDLLWSQSLDFDSISILQDGLANAPSRILSNLETDRGPDADLNRSSNGPLQEPFDPAPGNTEHFTLDDLMLGIYGGETPSGDYQMMSDQKSTLDYGPLTPQLCGLTGDMDPYVLRHYQYNDHSEFLFSKLAIRRVEDGPIPVQFLLSKKELSADSRIQTNLSSRSFVREEDSEVPDEIVPPEVGDRLIELFLRFINPQFPIFSRANKPSSHTSPVHLLAAIYSITQPFTLFDDYLSIELAYSPPSPQTLTNVAWRSLNDDLSEPTIASLQTALILLLQPNNNPLLLESPLRWSLVGLTVSMAQTLGLHLDPSSWDLPPDEIETRKKLGWLVWVLDKWYAFSLGRPSHISRNNWLVIESYSAEDVSDSGNEIYTTNLSKLTNILDNVLADLFSLRSMSVLALDYQRSVSTARPLEQELDEWYKDFSTELERRNDVSTTDFSNATASLRIAYHAVRILIFRALLRPFQVSTPGTTPRNRDSNERLAMRAKIRRKTLEEVASILNLISSLTQEQYQAFWPPWSKTCFALVTHILLLLSVTSDRGTGCLTRSIDVNVHGTQHSSSGDVTNNEYSECRQALDRARTIFRLHTKTLDMVRFALLRTDAIFWLGWERVFGYK